MKKSILLLAVLLLVASLGARAQHWKRGRGLRGNHNISLGVKGGAAFSSFVGDDAGRPEYLTGPQAGVFANISLSQLIAFQPEVLYSRKGYEFNRLDQRLKLSYLDVPLAFHVNTDGFFLEVGPQLGFLLNAKAEAGSTSSDVKRSYNTLDVGYLGGLGYQFKEGLGIGARYNGGFTNVPLADLVTPTITIQRRQRNSSIQLYLTYSFNAN